jgi:FixJ family two-component response regulator
MSMPAFMLPTSPTQVQLFATATDLLQSSLPNLPSYPVLDVSLPRWSGQRVIGLNANFIALPCFALPGNDQE